MITGTVNSQHDAVTEIEIRNTSDERFIFDAAIDTGLNRSLTMPLSVINALDLQLTATEPFELGNDVIVLLDGYDVQVMWNGEWRQVNAQSNQCLSACRHGTACWARIADSSCRRRRDDRGDALTICIS